MSPSVVDKVHYSAVVYVPAPSTSIYPVFICRRRDWLTDAVAAISPTLPYMPGTLFLGHTTAG